MVPLLEFGSSRNFNADPFVHWDCPALLSSGKIMEAAFYLREVSVLDSARAPYQLLINTAVGVSARSLFQTAAGEKEAARRKRNTRPVWRKLSHFSFQALAGRSTPRASEAMGPARSAPRGAGSTSHGPRGPGPTALGSVSRYCSCGSPRAKGGPGVERPVRERQRGATHPSLCAICRAQPGRGGRGRTKLFPVRWRRQEAPPVRPPTREDTSGPPPARPRAPGRALPLPAGGTLKSRPAEACGLERRAGARPSRPPQPPGAAARGGARRPAHTPAGPGQDQAASAPLFPAQPRRPRGHTHRTGRAGLPAAAAAAAAPLSPGARRRPQRPPPPAAGAAGPPPPASAPLPLQQGPSCAPAASVCRLLSPPALSLPFASSSPASSASFCRGRRG